MSDTPAADEAETELVLDPGSFTGPERRELQQRFKVPFGDLLGYTLDVISKDEPVPVLTGADGALVFPDEVLQVMVWVQSRRADPDAKLEDFDHLTLRDLNNARARRYRGPKAPTSGSSTTSPSESPSADSSPA